MRLLHVTHQYRPAIGGAEKYIVDLSEELAARGHHVDLFTTRSHDFHTWHNDLPASQTLGGVHVSRFDSLPRTARAWRALRYGLERYWPARKRRYEPLIFFGSGPVSAGLFRAVLTSARQYDLIHINQLHYSHAWTAFRAAWLRGLPIVLTPHMHPEQPATYDIGYLQTVVRGSDLVFADTSAEQRHLSALGWCRDVTVGGTGLRLSDYPQRSCAEARRRLELADDGFVILFLGRKEDYKGIDVCVRALCALNNSASARRAVTLLAFGPETDFSRRLWARVGPVRGLVVRDAVSDGERLDALAACNVLALPSSGEAFGIVYLEAWAYAKPVIGARIASVSSLITDGVDGYLIEPGDSEALAARWKCIMEHPEEARDMGARGHAKLVRRHTVARIADIIEGAYARVMRRRASQAQAGG